jgi:hypothetical protein
MGASYVYSHLFQQEAIMSFEVKGTFFVLGAALLAAGSAMAEDLAPYPVKGQVVQVLAAFDNPEGAIFSADGRYVLISNAAELGMPDKGFHWVEKAGYVSKLRVGRDGKLQMEEEKLISGLTAPLGMAVTPVATGSFPKGSIFLCAGSAPMAAPDGTPIKDASRLDPKIVIFNLDGKVLGEIRMGPGSPFEKKGGALATLPNAADFDKEGNLYIAETGIGGDSFDPPIKTNGGVWMVPRESIDALAQGKDAELYFIAMPNAGPDGLEVAPDGSIHTNTVGKAAGMNDPAQGGMYRLTGQDFKTGRLPQPLAQGLGALDGLDFAGNVRLDTEIANTNSIVITPPGRKPMMLTFSGSEQFTGPADIAIQRQGDGYLLVIPELSATSSNDGKNQVTVVRLPRDLPSS